MKILAKIGVAALLVCLLASAHAQMAGKRPDPSKTPKTPGELVIITKGAVAGACPLKHTDVKAQVSGFVARVTVVQEFTNPTSDKIEAVYTFPLPENAAVDRMEMKVGDRIIEGEIHKREEAKQIYEEAKAQGHVASLLDQERPNIFTQSVANIVPGAQVKIRISYTQLLKYEAGTYEFNFPMVVGPRFNPGTPTGQQGTGMAADTDKVPDASKISPPITPKDTRAGHDISLSVQINAGVQIHDVKCESHDVDTAWDSTNAVTVSLKDQATIPNKDFVLKYDVAGEMVQSGIITTAPTSGGGYFTLILQPPKAPKPQTVTPKEMIFVIDTSGSQQGEPLKKSKETMLYCIKNMNPGDTFNMISFSNDVKKLFDKPQPYNAENDKKAVDYLVACEAGGGTYMVPPMKEALAGPYDSKRLRIVVFFTDGYIGNDFEMADFIQKNLGQARVFSFGIGNSVNRFLIEKMGEVGRGASDVVLLNSDSAQIAAKFYDRIRSPLVTDIKVDFNGLPVAVDDIYPKLTPDLFSSQPMAIKGYYTSAASGEIIVRGKVAGEDWEQRIPVDLPEKQLENDALASQWARAKVENLMSQDWMGAQNGKPNPQIKDEIVKLALEYHLMTQYTSFVAVEKKTVTEGGKPKTIAVPVEMPDGVSYEGIFGDKVEAEAASARFYNAGQSTFGLGAVATTARPSAPATYAYVRKGKVAMTDGSSGNLTLRGSAVTNGPGAKPAVGGQFLWPEGIESAKPFDLDNSIIVKGDEEGIKRFRQIAKSLENKFDQPIKELLVKYSRDAEKGSYAVPGKLDVKGGKVRVAISVKSGAKDVITKLAALGFTGYSRISGTDRYVGWISIKKLWEAANKDYVTKIEAYCGQVKR